MERPPLAWRWVTPIAILLFVILLALSTRYGYHRDELYFRVLADHPAWGYVDQPPLTPLLAKLSMAVFGDTIFALRVFPALASAILVVLAVLITRELGGARVAQLVTALGISTGAYTLIAGHTMLTLSFDLPFWAAAILFVIRALLRDQPRWWLAVGVVVGLATYNKHLIAMLVLSLLIGLVAVGPRKVLLSPWLWAGGLIAVALAAPNLIYQATHGWPQLDMAAALSDDNGGQMRAMFVPMQLTLFGPVVTVIGAFGWWRLWKDRRVRALAIAYPAAAALTLISGGRFDYTAGLILLLFAAGCVSVEGASLPKVRFAAWSLVVNGLISAVIALPLLPVATMAATPIPAINEVTAESVGWPEFDAAVSGILATLSPEDRAKAIVMTGSYGEQGSLAQAGIPRVYSAHNELFNYGPPPDDAQVAVMVDIGQRGMDFTYNGCEEKARVDNRVGVDNEMQGMPIYLCRGLKQPWSVAWPSYQHYS
jgi:4-amino-4-deoxy-L-arabinose transferase-like glycosyltransferase